ncbi:type VII secretion protein EccB [Streptoalloteichus hindustanus]|uniref:Type VII secretion protein EccB n=1 Tax=Streptoalloteichus hindustanus TaxID=2017 RepID=A0A1M5PVJ3_STRHI|nr:type VII secretion protein EccB [Streptoalloteichus hindustanus]SHH05712.1 type VII secretion protein EccB [Streptoalloteichus hindustanus]
MQNKRDQLHAHLFVVGRLVSALVRGEPDAQETPMRRTTVGAAFGALLGVVLMVGFLVYGLVVRGGDDSWRQPGSIVVEKETGSRYLFLDGTLRPALNYTSALLAAGGGKAEVRTVPRSSLDGVPHGLPVGIPDAPDALPAPPRLVTDSWQVCSAAVSSPGAVDRPGVAVSVGRSWPAEAVPEDRAVPVSTQDGAHYLVWRGKRMKVVSQAVLVALGFGGSPPVRVDPSWLNALPAGPDLTPPAVRDRGAQGPRVAGQPTRVGQVFEVTVTGGAKDHYLVRADGLSALSGTDLALLLADPDTARAYPGQPVRPIPLTPAAVAEAPKSATAQGGSGLPGQPPAPAADLDGRALCVELGFAAEGAGARLVTVDQGRVRVAAAGRPARAGAADERTADQVRVAAGAGALVVGQPAPGVRAGTKYLITDVGIKFPLPSDEVTRALGYDGSAPVPVPTSVLAFVPTGPALDPEAARTQRSTP